MPDTKAQVRERLRALRATVDPSARAPAGDAVAARVLALPELASASTVGVYVAVRDELPTRALVDGLHSRGVTVAVPRVIGAGVMELRLIQEPLVPGRFGIPTSDGAPVPNVDVIVCPGLAFDARGGRLGYGGGYFDRWLTTHPDTVAIGVCADEAIVAEVPTEATDHPMAVVVTPTRTLRPHAVRVVAGVWIRDGRVLAAQRGPGRARPGLWELPGGKVEPDESDAAALARELAEELHVSLTVGAFVAETVHVYPDLTVHLVAYEVAADGAPRPAEHAELRWLSAGELDTVAWAPADLPLLSNMRTLLDR